MAGRNTLASEFFYRGGRVLASLLKALIFLLLLPQIAHAATECDFSYIKEKLPLISEMSADVTPAFRTEPEEFSDIQSAYPYMKEVYTNTRYGYLIIISYDKLETITLKNNMSFLNHLHSVMVEEEQEQKKQGNKFVYELITEQPYGALTFNEITEGEERWREIKILVMGAAGCFFKLAFLSEVSSMDEEEWKAALNGVTDVHSLMEEYEKDIVSLTSNEESLLRGKACNHYKFIGESEYNDCVKQEEIKLRQNNAKPDYYGMPDDKVTEILESCLKLKNLGSAKYYQCQKRLISLYRKSHKYIVEEEHAQAESFHWPEWSRQKPNTNITFTHEVKPAVLFKDVAPSIYMIYAFESIEEAKRFSNYSQGSAVAISDNRMLTNCHVVENNAIFFIGNEDEYDVAELINADPEYDKCVLRALSLELKPVLGYRKYSDLEVGEVVYAIGSPQGLEKTLSDGLISGLRKGDKLKLIQTSATISPGSSGGGLFDSKGNLIGITTLSVNDSQALNFAIAIDDFIQ